MNMQSFIQKMKDARAAQAKEALDNSAREAGHNVQCKNNVKQLALALLASTSMYELKGSGMFRVMVVLEKTSLFAKYT